MSWKPWTNIGYSTSAFKLMYEGVQVAIVDFRPDSLAASGPEDWECEIFIIDALNEKSNRDRPRDDTA